MARYRIEFEELGRIKSKAVNGLSIFEKGGKNGGSGQISGGEIGDVVVREKENPAAVMIFSADEWEAMPKDEAALKELTGVVTLDEKKLQVEVANLRVENAELKARVQELENLAGGESMAEPKKSKKAEASLDLDKQGQDADQNTEAKNG